MQTNRIVLVLTALLCAASVCAQQTDGSGATPANAPAAAATRMQTPDLLTMDMDSYVNLHLPPLHVLLENARERASQVQMFDAKRQTEERELKTVRRSWLEHIHLNSTFSYGSTDINSQMFYDNNYPVVQSVSGTDQRWWNVGASISLPLDEIFNRRNRIKQQKARIENVRYEVETWYDEICLKIIDEYTSAVEQLAMLGNAASTMATAQAQYVATEMDFVNGKVDARALSYQKGIEKQAIQEYQQARSQLNKALLRLEVLSKTPILSKPQDGAPVKQ